MQRFNVGDTVTVVRSGWVPELIGLTGVIVSIHPNHQIEPYLIQFDNGGRVYFAPDEIERNN